MNLFWYIIWLALATLCFHFAITTDNTWGIAWNVVIGILCVLLAKDFTNRGV